MNIESCYGLAVSYDVVSLANAKVYCTACLCRYYMQNRSTAENKSVILADRMILLQDRDFQRWIKMRPSSNQVSMCFCRRAADEHHEYSMKSGI